MERDFICGYSITAHYIQYMHTVPSQYIWFRAAVWLCEPAVTPFTFSMWAKLCISSVYGEYALICDMCSNDWSSVCLPLVAVSAKWMERKGGLLVQTYHDYIEWNWKQRWADVSDLWVNQSLLLSPLSFEFSLWNIIESFSCWELTAVWRAGLKSQHVPKTPTESILHLKCEWTYGRLPETKVLFH